jgi:hypothetical protein
VSIEQLPEHARRVAAVFADGLQSLGASWIVGSYIHGSATMDDYQPRRSDLDVVVVTERELSSQEVKRIGTLHNYYPRPWLNGLYVSQATLTGPPRSAPTPIIAFDGGRVWPATSQAVNPIIRHELATRGVALFGPDLDRATLQQHPEELKRWVRRNMNDYWGTWVDRATHRPIDALSTALLSRRIAWGVLGISRQLYTLREGGVISKTHAGEYALEHVASEHHRILREALRIRHGDAGSEYPHRLLRRHETLRYMRDVIARYGQAAT